MDDGQKPVVKLLDIAQASGVSLAAVSLALRDKPGISTDTRERVLAAARSLGYPFKSAQTENPRKEIRTIGLLVKSGLRDRPYASQYYSDIITGVESICRQMGLNLMFSALPVGKDNRPVEMPALLEKGSADAFLIASLWIDKAMSRLLDNQSCPIVLLDSYCPTRRYPAVLTDHFQGAYRATEYLLARGHRRIGFIGGSDQAYPNFRERRLGYQRAVAEAAVEPCFADCSTNPVEVAAVAVDLLKRRPEITALVGVNDDVAISAMYALIDAGYRVPQEISLVGFDDIYLGKTVVPSLTTLHVDKQSMGRLAVQMLLDQAPPTSGSPADGGIATHLYHPVLIERESVADRENSQD